MKKISKDKIQHHLPDTIILSEDVKETYPLHWHNAAEFILILKDKCRHRIGDSIYEAMQGDILLIWPHQVHETIKIPHKGTLMIQFPSDILDNNLELLSIVRFLYPCHKISSRDDPELAAFIRDKFMDIKKMHSSADPFSETRCKLYIYDIILAIGEKVLAHSKKETEDKNTGNAGWNYITDACKYIVEHSTENLTQSLVANQIGLSAFYFSKLFKQYMKMSFPTYLSNVRVKNAVSLLLDDDLTITECAYQAGFQSTTTFNKVFRDLKGHTPREFRKLYR